MDSVAPTVVSLRKLDAMKQLPQTIFSIELLEPQSLRNITLACFRVDFPS
jgi:hypothetical protein